VKSELLYFVLFHIHCPNLYRRCKPYAVSYYIHSDATVFVNYNTSGLTLEATAGSYMTDLGLYVTLHSNNIDNGSEAYSSLTMEQITKCHLLIADIACSVVYPYCDHENSPRSICKHSCDVLQEECEFFLDSAFLPVHKFELDNDRRALLAGCDSRVNPASESPECVFISIESPSTGECFIIAVGIMIIMYSL